MHLTKKNTQGLTAIIFDLGGVLLNIDYHLTVKAFENLGFNNFENEFSQYKQSSISDEFETGEISGEEFFKELSKKHKISREGFDDAWNALLPDFPKERFVLLQELSKDFDLYLCSNTNEIHYKAFRKTVDQFGVDFDGLFKQVYYSHLVGDRKPNSSIFKTILTQNKLEASQTLFIDDSIQHITVAKQLGIKTKLAKEITVHEIFADWLN